MNGVVQVAVLIKACGRVDGRVKLQKIVHILQQVGFPFKEHFGYLHHGPYSSELKGEIDQLVDFNLVQEEEKQAGEYKQYVYMPGGDLDGLLRHFGGDGVPAWGELAKRLNAKQSKDLEAISTIMFLQSREFDGERLRERFLQLKPHLADRLDPCLAEANELRQRGGA